MKHLTRFLGIALFILIVQTPAQAEYKPFWPHGLDKLKYLDHVSKVGKRIGRAFRNEQKIDAWLAYLACKGRIHRIDRRFIGHVCAITGLNSDVFQESPAFSAWRSEVMLPLLTPGVWSGKAETEFLKGVQQALKKDGKTLSDAQSENIRKAWELRGFEVNSARSLLLSNLQTNYDLSKADAELFIKDHGKK